MCEKKTPVCLDLTWQRNRQELYLELEEKLGWKPVWGRNLDAIWDVLSGMEYKGMAFQLSRRRDYGDEALERYIDKLCAVFTDAQEPGDITVQVEYTEE